MSEIQDVSVLLQQRRGNRKRTWLPSHESPTRTRTNLARIWTSSTWYSLAKQGSKASKIGQESFEDVLREMQSSLDWRNRRSQRVRKRNECVVKRCSYHFFETGGRNWCSQKLHAERWSWSTQIWTTTFITITYTNLCTLILNSSWCGRSSRCFYGVASQRSSRNQLSCEILMHLCLF